VWGNVKYFHNNQGKGFRRLDREGGLCRGGHRVVDFDRRGVILTKMAGWIMSCGNLGLNTQYRADANHPRAAVRRRFQGRWNPAINRSPL